VQEDPGRRVELLQYGRVLEHVGQHDEAHVRAADVAMRACFAASRASERHDGLLANHVILG